MEDQYVSLAKLAIEAYIKIGKTISPSDNLSKVMLTKKAGVFVSIHKKDGSLRGCIGTFMPTKKTIAREIITNAIAAATQDPRFPPVTEQELPDLEISVDILSKPKLAKDTQGEETAQKHTGSGRMLSPGVNGKKKEFNWKNKLNPKHYGLIVSTADGRRGLLLPDIPGVETPEQQIAICRQKGGIGPKEPITLEVFTVERHCEHSD